MKKLILSLFAVVMAIGAMSAGQNKSITEARIYINPGHGSWTGNDRNMGTINHATGDTTGFYESNTNLWKGLKLRQILIDWGMPADNICMSRVKNGPYPHTDADAELYNRDLTEIAEEANAFNSDYFLSIHSDAGAQNHTLLIHKGYTTPANDSYMYHGTKYTAKELMEVCSGMANVTWPILTSNGIDVMDAPAMQPGKTPSIYGDFTFYYGWKTPAENTGKSGYLGVLRRNTCPGFLSEGFSHQYMPATHRALNPDYCGQEGMRYARGMAEWFGWEKDTKGYIMGAVKDLHNRMEIPLYGYAKGTIDQWRPVNNIEVTLYKGDVEVATYKGDDEWNGVFVFEKLEPGDDYTIKVSAPDYKSSFDLDAEYGRENTKYSVVANETTYPIIYLERSDYAPNPCYNYPNPGHEAWQMVPSKFEMRQDFVNKGIAALEGKTIRREIAHGDSIYVLAHDADSKPYIYVVNALTQELYGEISTEGVGDASDDRELMTISDIAFTSDSILVACNLEKISFGSEGVSGTLRFYKWAKDDVTRTPTGNPEIWFTSTSNQACGNFSNAESGKSLAVSGRLEDCKVITTAKTLSGNKIRIPIFTITRKGLTNETRNQDNAITTDAIGEDYQIVVSPRDDNAFVIDGSNTAPIEYAMVEASASAPILVGAMSTDLVPAAVTGATYFKYANSAMMVTPKFDADGKVAGVALYNVQNGFDNAVLVETTNTGISAVDAAYVMASSHVEGEDLTLYLNNGGAVSRFTTLDVEQASYNNVYAYDLNATVEGTDYTFSFVANEDCVNGGRLLFYDAASGDFVGEIALDNVTAGENTKVVAATELPGADGQKLNWAVEVSSNRVTHIKPLVDKADFKYTRAFVTVDKSTESSKFGNIYVSNYAGINKAASGVCVVGPNLHAYNTTAYNGGTNFNKNQTIACDPNGNIYVTDLGVSRSGLWVANPWALTNPFSQFFGGTLQSDGAFTDGDTQVGGLTSYVDFYGTGADTKMYAYQKNTAGKYVINVYNVGNEDGTLASQWTAAPSEVIELPADMKADASINVVEQGIWVGQTSNDASANTETSPAYMFIDNEGNITFNSATSDVMGGVNHGSAIAVSKDGKMLVTNVDKVFYFYNVEWNGSTPSITLAYTYTHEIGIGSTKNADGNYIEQMTFDYAGRLVAAGRYLGVFTVPAEENVCETAARSFNTVTKGTAVSGIEEVGADVDAPVEYYNLQGVKVANPSNGVFIKKQGNKATKVVL